MEPVKDFDQILPLVDSWGRYQKRLFLLLVIPAAIPCAFQILILVFLQATPEHWCRISELQNKGLTIEDRKRLSTPLKQGNVVQSPCQSYQIKYDMVAADVVTNGIKRFLAREDQSNWELGECKSNNWTFDKSLYQSTIVTDWFLVCDKDWAPFVILTMWNLGSAIGTVLFGQMGDKIGRRHTFFIVLAVQVFFAIIRTFMPEFVSFGICSFFVGLTIPTIFQLPYLLGVEMVGPQKRNVAAIGFCLAYTTALCVVPGIAYLLPNWKHLSLATSVPTIFFFLYWWIMPESARWLLAVGKVDAAKKLMESVARENRSDITNVDLRKMLVDVTKNEMEKTYNVSDLFKTPNMRHKTILVIIAWTANVVLYYGLSYYIPGMSGNDYLNFFISSAIELPTYIVLYPVMEKIGRRWSTCFWMVLGGVSCILTAAVPNGIAWLTVGLALIGKFSISVSFVIMYAYSSEIFPTVMRAAGLGLTSTVAGFCNVIVPWILYMGTNWVVLPVLIMGVFTVVCGLLVLALPETLNLPMSETIEEADKVALHKFTWQSCQKLFSMNAREASKTGLEDCQPVETIKECEQEPEAGVLNLGMDKQVDVFL